MNSREAFEKSHSNIRIFLKYCTFNEFTNDYESESLHQYTLGFVNGAWWAWQEQQKWIDELELKINNALEAMDGEYANSWGLWKEKADMYEQGASNAYERSYWILKGGEQ